MTGQILTLDESLQETIPAVLSLLNALPDDSPFRQLAPPQRRQRTLDGLKRLLLRETQLLIGRTEGNPLFLEESARALVETERLRGEPGRYRLAQDLPTVQVPATVQAILAARIDRLPPDEKRLVQTAAVGGTEGPLALLQAIADMSEEALYRGLTHLQAAEFLYEMSLFPERLYTFKHALTHEVAYGRLLQERRRMLHGTIVAAIEWLSQDRVVDQVERLAHHALRGAVWDKAVTYCHQAGVKATDRSAYQEAIASLDQVLAALRHLPEDRARFEQAIDIRLHLHPVLSVLKRFQPALDLLREAEVDAERLHDQRRLGQVLSATISCWWHIGAPERAVEYGKRACALAAALGDAVLQMRSILSLGQTYVTMGHYWRAADCLRATIEALQGDLLSQRLGAPTVPAVSSRAWLVLSLALSFHGVTSCLGAAYVLAGRMAAALPLLERVVAQTDAMGVIFGYVLGAIPLGEGYLRAGRSEDALHQARHVLEVCRRPQQRGHEAWALRLLGEVATQRHPPEGERAEASYQEASPWPTNSACVPSRRTVTVALARCIARPGSPSTPVPNCPPPSRCTAIWT